MKTLAHPRFGLAMTIKDLLAINAATALLVCALSSTLSASWNNSHLASCANNLRLITQALRVESVEHGNGFVWWGGRFKNYQRGSPNAWENLAVLSNYLSSARVLACPSDVRMPPIHFGEGANGLKNAVSGQNNAVSYFVGIDALPYLPGNILLGDRHLATSRRQGCPMVSPFSDLAMPVEEAEARSGGLKWGKGLHGEKMGNIARPDGSVLQATDKTLVQVVAESEGDGNNNNHVLPPY